MKGKSVLFVGILCVGLSLAGAGVPAKKALDRVSAQFGNAAVQYLVSIKGEKGSPNPSEWTILAYDADNDVKVRHFWVGETESTNEGAEYSYYPDKEVPGFIPLERFKIDSLEALKTAEKAAVVARMGFDLVSYELRCREFSKEPFWVLKLTTEGGNLVGTVFISAENGDLLRTVWRDYKRVLPSGYPVIIDSAFPKKK